MKAWIALLFVLSGCVPIPIAGPKYPPMDYANKPPADWPKLHQIVTYGTVEEVTERCALANNLRDGVRKAGCALIYFGSNQCRIYLYSKDPDLLKHEQEHCLGYVHVGQGDIIHKAWAAHKAQK